MAKHTEPNPDPDARPDNSQVDPPVQPADDEAARYEAIRQLASVGELEFPPQADEIVGALLDTIAQRDEHQNRALRVMADMQNFQRRAGLNEREARDAALRGVVGSLIPLIDQFEIALSQDPASVPSEAVVRGVGIIRDEFLRTLAGYGVSPIAPRVGEEFQPGDHEAMMQLPAEGVRPGCISMVMNTGYKLGDRVVRPAKVGVAPQPAGTEGENE